jgi:sec-independent protein translocase protein TatC
MSVDRPMPIMEHITELISRLKIVLYAVVGFLLGVTMFPANPSRLLAMEYEPLVAVRVRPITEHFLPEDAIVGGFKFLDALTVYFLVGLSLSLIVCSPLIAYQLFKFVNPGLKSKERGMLYPFVASFAGLFVAGAAYAWFVIMPVTFQIMVYLTVSTGALPLFSLWDFFYLTFLGLISSGFFFTLPVLLYLMMEFEVLTVDTLTENRRWVLLVVLVVTAAITPDPTPISMAFLAVPFFVLYEVSVFLGKRVKKRKEMEEGVEAAERYLQLSR